MTAPIIPNPPVPAADLIYESPDDFYLSALSPWYARDLHDAHRWCVRWREHPEAVAKVEALWRAWERCNQDRGTGLAVWWANYADPTMERLLEPKGCFAGCNPDRHQPLAVPLPP